ncbi:serine hydrolase domain-containing protein [Sinomonas sp. JGH33]|uniref:Serine hydrolase domain-containing protein n=1 Tax=Sinomonas terricola TaxID=3110330 RepID=A0ABU5T5I6_9MICC|nr:serine hydrolase domain-containing protein [Sinomonas sp. JGH33]MEA5454936.1 serine hydrolase domain-containing protein [Sinomonas sp. JGH33]
MGFGGGAQRRRRRLPLERLLGRSVRVRRRRLTLLAVGAALVVTLGTIGFTSLGAGAVRASSVGRGPTPPPSAVTPVPAKPSPTAVPAPTASPTPTVTPTAAAPAAAPAPSWQELPPQAKAIVSQFLADQGAAGLAVAVSTGGAGGGAGTDYLATLGDAAQGVPWSADTRSAYRSITKSFVGTVVLELANEGKLALDDPISRYVPDLESVRGGGAITVRMALEMRTGVPEFSGTQGFSDQLNTSYTGAFTDDELLGYALAQPLDFSPGSQYEYSNTNFVLLGKVVEAVTGSPWDREVQSRILAPLGLQSVAYAGSNDPGASDPSQLVATPYELDSSVGLESLAQVSPSLYGASGGFFGNIGDLLRWGRALGSGELLPAALQQARLTAISNPQADDPGSPDYDAYGLAAGEIDGWWGHTGTGLGYESLTMYSPKTGMTVAILINTQLPNPNGPAVLFKQLEGALEALA